jgi:hypothetical protein
VIRFRVISRKDVPVNVFHPVAVAGVVQLPRLKCCVKGLASRHNLNKEIALSEIWQFVEFSDVLLEEDQRVTPVKLVIADDEDGVFELMDEIGVPSVYPQCDPVANETGIGSLVHLSRANAAHDCGARLGEPRSKMAVASSPDRSMRLLCGNRDVPTRLRLYRAEAASNSSR